MIRSWIEKRRRERKRSESGMTLTCPSCRADIYGDSFLFNYDQDEQAEIYHYLCMGCSTESRWTFVGAPAPIKVEIVWHG